MTTLPQSAQGLTLGCDLSHHNDDPQFHDLKAYGVGVVTLKASQGLTMADGVFADRRERALSVGLRVGAYHFLNPQDDPAHQAEHFLAVLGKLDPREMPPAVDVEMIDPKNGPDWATLGRQDRALRVARFLGIVQKATGRVPIIYTPHVWFGQTFDADLSRYPLWGARYAAAPGNLGKWKSFLGWQFTDKGTLPSLAPGTVDCSAWRVKA